MSQRSQIIKQGKELYDGKRKKNRNASRQGCIKGSSRWKNREGQQDGGRQCAFAKCAEEEGQEQKALAFFRTFRRVEIKAGVVRCNA